MPTSKFWCGPIRKVNLTALARQLGVSPLHVDWLKRKGAPCDCALRFALWRKTHWLKKCVCCLDLFSPSNTKQTTCLRAECVNRQKALSYQINICLEHTASLDRKALALACWRCKRCGKPAGESLDIFTAVYCSRRCSRIVYEKANRAKLTAWKRNKRQKCPQTKLAHRLRNRLREVMLSKKPESAKTLLGCSIPFFKTYLQEKFKPGMAWNNWGPYWELDHIVPIAAFDLTKPDERAACFHYSNFQPLTVEQNRSKHAKLIFTVAALLNAKTQNIPVDKRDCSGGIPD